MVLAAVVAQPHAAPLALPARGADAVPRLAGPVRPAVEAAALWKEGSRRGNDDDDVKSGFPNNVIQFVEWYLCELAEFQ